MSHSGYERPEVTHTAWLVAALMLVLVILLGFGLAFNHVQQTFLTEEFSKNVSNISQNFNDKLYKQARSLDAVLEALKNDTQLVDSLAAGDRDSLLQHTESLFHHLREEHAITHFYFTDPQRVNLLRVHQPQRYGDTIERKTTKIAETNGKLGAGLEMGPLGTLTLRVVVPWYKDKRLIGFVELGTEIEHLLEALPVHFGMHATVLLKKSLLRREDWESGMRMLGRDHDWMQHPEYVSAFSTQPQLYKAITHDLSKPLIAIDGVKYRVGAMPVNDVTGKEVARIALFSRMDTTREHEAQGLANAYKLYTAMGAGVTLIVLLILYYSRKALSSSRRKLDRAKHEWAEAFDAVAEPIFLHDEQMLLIHANRAYQKLSGMDQEEILGRRYWEVFPKIEGGLPGCIDRGSRCLDLSEDNPVIEDEFELPDGRAFHSRAYLINDEQGEFEYAIHMLQDITEKRKSQEQLQLSSVAFDNTVEGIMITDPQTNILTVNRGFCEITGYMLHEVLDEKPSLLQSGKHDRSFYAEMWESLENDNRWQGEVWNRRKNGEIYPQWLTISGVHNAEGILTHYVGIFADMTDLRRSQEALDHLTYHDALTGLPNRSLLRDRLEHALQFAGRNDSKVALLILNPKRIKMINESLGHTIGDALLKAIAHRLKSTLRQLDTITTTSGDEVEVDTLARLTGNEFAIILEDISEPKDANRVAQRMLEEIARPFKIDGHSVVTAASIGISIYPADAESVDDMIQCADTAAHRARHATGSNSCYYSADMTAMAAQYLELENDLRRGLGQDEFVVYFQPQYSINNTTLTGVEALVRWNHPQQGFISPARFIPLAEETGLIIPLGNQVLTKACNQAALWHEKGISIPVAVNLSARQFQESSLVADVRAALQESGLPPHLLELEITETCLMESGEEAVDILDDIKSIGVGLAMDDFGTGYSSLAYLKRFPIDKLKIDRAFVSDLPTDVNDAAIARAIISLAESLQLRVLAEGVETEEQLRFLQQEGCHEIQGFLRGRPMPAGELERLLNLPSVVV